jgi:hypothetical protein
MFLNVLNGPYLQTNQVDRQLVLSASETIDVERGSLLYMDANGEWRVASTTQAGDATTPGELLYIALQSDDDRVAMQANGYPATAGHTPKINGLSLATHMTIETDMFEGTPAIGDLLTVEDGKFVVAEIADSGKTIYGRCTKAPYDRIANQGVVVSNFRNGGGNVTVIEVATVYETQSVLA